jgi:hypothetical protein
MPHIVTASNGPVTVSTWTVEVDGVEQWLYAMTIGGEHLDHGVLGPVD